jgi:hypothetical protein
MIVSSFCWNFIDASLLLEQDHLQRSSSSSFSSFWLVKYNRALRNPSWAYEFITHDDIANERKVSRRNHNFFFEEQMDKVWAIESVSPIKKKKLSYFSDLCFLVNLVILYSDITSFRCNCFVQMLPMSTAVEIRPIVSMSKALCLKMLFVSCRWIRKASVKRDTIGTMIDFHSIDYFVL